MNPPGRPCGHTCSTSRPKLVNTHSGTCRQRPADATSEPQATWPPSSTGASQRSRLPTQVRCPGSWAYRQRCRTIPSGGSTWQSDPSWSPTSPTRFKIKSAKVTPSQSGHLREATRAPPSSAKSQYGGPPTASTPKTSAQPEELSSKCFRPCGNNASTGISRVPPTRQQMRGSTSDRQDAPHSVQATTG